MILTLKELANYLRVNERTIQRMLKTGQIQGAKIGGQWRFNGSQIERMFFPEAESEHPDAVELHELLRSHLSIPLSRIVSENRMLLDLQARDVEGVLDEMIVPFRREGLLLDIQDLKARLVAREKLLSTGVGNGVAIPHPRDPIPTLREPAVLVVGRSVHGIDYGALDNLPVHLFFLCCCQNIELHLHMMGQLARLLRENDFRELCQNCTEPRDVLRAILEAERRHFLDAP